MANTVVRTFDLYNTTFYWNGYQPANYSVQTTVASAYYAAQFSSNPIGSQIDFFSQLAGASATNPIFSVNGVTINSLPYLWGKYWYDQAMYYSNSLVLSAISTSYPSYYQMISESIGSLYYLSYYNSNSNAYTLPYNSILSNRIPSGISSAIQSFYQAANSLFVNNIAAIGPTGTDTSPNNSNLIMANTDVTRMQAATTSLIGTINGLYPALSSFLSYNTQVIGNLITPYNWTIKMPYEDTLGTVTVDIANRTISNQIQLTTSSLSAQNENVS